MLATNTYIWMVANRTSVNITEGIAIRGGFSIYSGWVTAATILNLTFMLKYFGYADPNIAYVDEEQWAIIILIIASALYNVASIIE
jgi:hypothetical protein